MPLRKPSIDAEMRARTEHAWALQVGDLPLLVRPSRARDLAAVARMHHRCSARSLLDRYRLGGRAPAVATVEASLRRPHGIVAVTSDGDVIAAGTLEFAGGHENRCAEVGLLVEDRWQQLGIGTELLGHLSGVAQVAGFDELIAYPATALDAGRRLMVGIGRTWEVSDPEVHLHTSLTEAASLRIGSARQWLAS